MLHGGTHGRDNKRGVAVVVLVLCAAKLVVNVLHNCAARV